jgi:hypothetical protein
MSETPTPVAAFKVFAPGYIQKKYHHGRSKFFFFIAEWGLAVALSSTLHGRLELEKVALKGTRLP